MNIVIIPAFFQTIKRPTLGSFFMDQARALKYNGHNVTILYCDTYSVKCVGEYLTYKETEHVQNEGIDIYRNKVFCPLKHGIEGHKEAFAKGIQVLWKQYIELADKKVDIIHAHCAVWAGYAAMKLNEKTGIPYVVTEHATLFYLHKDTISQNNREIIKKIFQNAAGTVCVSRAFANLMQEFCNDGQNSKDIKVIGNVVDFNLFNIEKNSSIKENKGYIEKNKYTFLTVCYMQEEAQLKKKGIDILLKAWQQVCETYPEAQLIIGGGGKAKSVAQDWCKQLGIEEKIVFLGELNRNQVSEEMKKCDCFVLPSRYETFGVVYVEAFACGKPVIGVANGGPDDFVNDTNGILISANEAEMTYELCAAMAKMIEADKSRYNPDFIRKQAKDRFSMGAIANELEKTYNIIMGNA